ncbi:MAG: hypothetical protein C0467_29195 [Planctomycetaceae bacterium]|nr:hypothetical protein [Planctomycetaceae bacterium]
MTRDHFYQQIVTRLNGRLDPELFERCATQLLWASYPGLVPVRGGGDMGMDGAVADGDGRAYPLVCTIGEDVIGNLRKSLASYLEGKGPRRHVVSATSQALTPARQRNLEAAAEELGFTLVAVHEQADFANRLYRDPRWCLELLALPHDPPPLSALPRTVRPASMGELVGRAEDLAWLKSMTGDVLVVGQPGMGKTALLAELARSGDGLFVVAEDVGQIVAGVREYQPPALMVDDAHMCPNLLVELRRQRVETGAAFRIIADCWPGEEEAVARALHVTNSSVRRLEPLPRNQIVTVIRRRGIGGPDSLLRELIRQSDGRPGLAVTLCDICVREDTTRSVVLGDALARDVRTTFERLVGRDAVTILACFAVGGGGGMEVGDVASYIGLSLARISEVVSGLAAGGVLVELDRQRLAVRPEPLRHSLVRDVFFNGATALVVDPLLGRAPVPEEATRTLIGARARGGRVPVYLLTDRLRLAGDQTLLEFSYLSPRECRWVMENMAARFRAVSEAALEYRPSEAVERLLTVQQESDRESATTLLRQWVEAARPGSEEPLRRRRIVLRATMRRLGSGDPHPPLAAACVALSPSYGEYRSDPADRYRTTHYFGLITTKELGEVRSLWPEVRDQLATVAGTVGDWKPVQELYRMWAHPGLGRVRADPDTLSAMTGFAAEMLDDLAILWRDRLGLLHWAWQMAALRGAELPTALPADLVTLYPLRELGTDWQEKQNREHAAALALAARWATERPEVVANRLSTWEAAITASGRSWSSCVCASIAERTLNLGEWADAFAVAGVPGGLASPFLARNAFAGEPGWEDRLAVALERPATEGTAVTIILGLPGEPPKRLWDTAWDRLSRFTKLLLVVCGKQMPEERMERLLGHPDPEVAAEVAMGEWYSEPKGSVRPTLSAAWRQAVARGAEYVPTEAWDLFPGLARDWLATRLARSDLSFHAFSHDADVFDRLTTQERLDLLNGISLDNLWSGEAVHRVVGKDEAVFVYLLADERLACVRLAPLWGPPTGAWPALAGLALEAGIEPEQVAEAAFHESFAFRGNESDYWRPWQDGFAALATGPNPLLRRVGEIGTAEAERRITSARREERREAVYGDD